MMYPQRTTFLCYVKMERSIGGHQQWEGKHFLLVTFIFLFTCLPFKEDERQRMPRHERAIKRKWCFLLNLLFFFLLFCGTKGSSSSLSVCYLLHSPHLKNKNKTSMFREKFPVTITSVIVVLSGTQALLLLVDQEYSIPQNHRALCSLATWCQVSCCHFAFLEQMPDCKIEKLQFVHHIFIPFVNL